MKYVEKVLCMEIEKGIIMLWDGYIVLQEAQGHGNQILERQK